MIVSCWYELVFSFQVNILLHYIAWLSSEWQQVWYISGVDWKLGQYSGLSQWLTNSMYTMCSKLSCICHLFEHFCLWLQEDIYGKVESFIFIFVILLFVLYLKWKKVGITDKLVLVWLFLKTSELFCFIFLTSLKLLFSSLSFMQLMIHLSEFYDDHALKSICSFLG